MTESLEDFRDRALEFLHANATARADDAFVWGRGPDDVAAFTDADPGVDLAGLEAARAWRRTKFDAGFGWLSGPTEFGGRDLAPAFQHLFDQLEAEFDIPDQNCFTIGLGMVAPTMAAHATEIVNEAHLAALVRGDIIGCQLFSEPGAGSDLAAISTRAERDGDDWIITGQKVWTSGAHYSDIGEVLVCSDPDRPRHRNLTAFIVDMHDPAIEIRPLRQMTGSSNFNEVFFNGLRVPDDYRLGEVNDGWRVALTTLMNERATISGGSDGTGLANHPVELVRAMQLSDSAVMRQQLADLLINQSVAGWTSRRAMDRIESSGLPGPELSVGKLAGSINMRRLGAFASTAIGAKLVADSGEWGTYAWSQLVLGTPGVRLAGGTDEVMRNILGERVLGLPKEPSPPA